MNCTTESSIVEETIHSDVTVMGGGLSGLATCLRLSKAGLKVTCVEPVTEFSTMVGESLDWSAPELLNQLGLPMDDLIRREVSTFKRHVIMTLADNSTTEYVPGEWLARPPLNVELRTLHLDRVRLHRDLQQMAVNNGVHFIQDRVIQVEHTGRMITSVRTEKGRCLSSNWFIDAAGAGSSLLARLFHLPVAEYGPKKVAMWTYFGVSERKEGTTLYASADQREYMKWIWEIPIRPGVISVGCVCAGAEVKRERAQGLSVQQVFRRRLVKFSRFHSLVDDIEIPKPHVTSFTCRVVKNVCGPNWIIVGEAASLPDPITGNGVTTALRHAAEASKLILRFQNKSRISLWARMVYNMRVFQMGKFFNSLIEKMAYNWPIRDRMGLLSAGDAYTIPAWSINQIYARLGPDGLLGTGSLCLLMASLRGAAWFVYHVCRLIPAGRPVLAEAKN
jgi:flavin-dependent dehydrogenase